MKSSHKRKHSIDEQENSDEQSEKRQLITTESELQTLLNDETEDLGLADNEKRETVSLIKHDSSQSGNSSQKRKAQPEVNISNEIAPAEDHNASTLDLQQQSTSVSSSAPADCQVQTLTNTEDEQILPNHWAHMEDNRRWKVVNLSSSKDHKEYANVINSFYSSMNSYGAQIVQVQ